VVSCSDHSYSQYALCEGRLDLEGERDHTRYLTNPLAIRVPESQIGTRHYLLNLQKLTDSCVRLQLRMDWGM
jgi:hypothetical protein